MLLDNVKWQTSCELLLAQGVQIYEKTKTKEEEVWFILLHHTHNSTGLTSTGL